MAETPSTMVELGTPLPELSLPDFDGAIHSNDIEAHPQAACTPDQIPSVGCNIKWKPGKEPSFFGLN